MRDLGWIVQVTVKVSPVPWQVIRRMDLIDGVAWSDIEGVDDRVCLEWTPKQSPGLCLGCGERQKPLTASLRKMFKIAHPGIKRDGYQAKMHL